MLLGLLTDIHEHIENTRAALDLFREAGVERVIVLGDVTMIGRRLVPAVALLRGCDAVGVWGNHDLGLCLDPKPELRAKYGDAVLDYMGSLRGQLVVEGCRFSHVDPWLDPTDPLQIWWFESRPDEPGQARRSFDAVPESHLFVGHYHRWLVVTPEGPLPWRGEGPIRLGAARQLVVVHAVFEGHAATYDTVTRLLTPLRLDTA